MNACTFRAVILLLTRHSPSLPSKQHRDHTSCINCLCGLLDLPPLSPKRCPCGVPRGPFKAHTLRTCLRLVHVNQSVLRSNGNALDRGGSYLVPVARYSRPRPWEVRSSGMVAAILRPVCENGIGSWARSRGREIRRRRGFGVRGGDQGQPRRLFRY
jgi:hypothetical protein